MAIQTAPIKKYNYGRQAGFKNGLSALEEDGYQEDSELERKRHRAKILIRESMGTSFTRYITILFVRS